MTVERCERILRNSERFYNEYNDPCEWGETISKCYRMCDKLIADLILITTDNSLNSYFREATDLIELITKMKTDYLTYWMDVTIQDVRDLETEKDSVWEQVKNFESKSITTFSIVLTMLSFILSTANGIANSFSAIDILEIAIIYGFSISLFCGIIVLFSASNSEKIKKGISFILIAILLILAFMLIKGNLYG